MIKRIFLLFFALLFILSVGFIIVSAEDNITETSTVTETTTVETTVTETSSDDNNVTLTDINQKMIFIIFGLFCIVGCLIAQGFSFWKW